MNQQDIVEVLTDCHTIIVNSHFVYTGGRHGSSYVNKDRIYPDTLKIGVLCMEIAGRFAGDKVEVVIAPAVGGVIMSHLVAHALTLINGYSVLSVYAEKGTRPMPHDDLRIGDANYETGLFVISRGHEKLMANKNVLVVDDVLTTGGTADKVIHATRTAGGKVIGLGVLCNRGGVTPSEVGEVPKLVSLLDLALDSYTEDDCPLCRQGVPINKDIGWGAEWLARRKDNLMLW